MRPAYDGEELFFEQNKSFLKNLLFLRQKIVINFPKNSFQPFWPQVKSPNSLGHTVPKENLFSPISLVY